ncbi:MAG TPA: hypothetical protein VK666_01675 [Chryseolinea sp.]|nr:hypothetical protein [Chryseolinea sp.]
MLNTVNEGGRKILMRGIEDYLMTQLKSEFGEDIELVSHKLQYLIMDHSLKDLRLIVRQEIQKAKKEQQLAQGSSH